MATKKITQKTIRALVKEGAATDLETMKNKPSRKDLDLIATSFGTTEMNGALFTHRKTKKIYAITRRSSMLFEYI